MAGLLHRLSGELADFRSVQYSIDPDVAATLYDASRRLPGADTAAMLAQAAQDLQRLDLEAVGELADAVSALKGLNEETVSQLVHAAETIRSATARLPEY
jgi:hypothetical protein